MSEPIFDPRKAGCMLLVVLGACVATPDTDESADELSLPFGQHFFNTALPHTNGRACATCHIEADHFALTPAHVAAAAPTDPIFNRIDADDPDAAVPTYDHLKAGLVRVTVKLADNLDVIDGSGNVITNADRTISLWRGVPTVENVSYTAPYQLDGRAPTLTAQALGALRAHSQITVDPPRVDLDLIADFEKTVYSSPAAVEVAIDVALGRTPPPVNLHLRPGTDAAEGQKVFLNICARCHGSGTTNSIVEQPVFDSFFPVQHADGTIDIAGFLPTGVAIPAAFMQNVPRTHEGTLVCCRT